MTKVLLEHCNQPYYFYLEMNRLCLFLITLFLLSPFAAASFATALEDLEVAGPVKSIKLGKLIEDKPSFGRQLFYNQVGQIVKEVGLNYLQMEKNYIYDQDGRLLRSFTDSLALKSSSEYFYDERGNEIESRSFDKNGNVTMRFVKIYDASDRPIEWQIITVRDGAELVEAYSYEYDANGNLSSHTKYRDDRASKSYETVPVTFVKERDAQGNVIEEYSKGPYDEAFSLDRAFRYDEHRNVIEEKSYGFDGALSWHTTYIYDEHSRLIEERIVKRRLNGEMEDEFVRYSYKFDSRGNWTRKTAETYYDEENTFFPDEQEVEVREITYH